jgi:hypothetical protein
MRKTNKRRTYRKKHSTIKKRSSRRYRKHKKYNALAKGPDSDYSKVNCCMCGKEIYKTNGLIPAACLRTYGAIRGHRICKECWFSKFAKEGVNHSCPGCVKGLPLNGPAHNPSAVVDLTADD